MILYSYQFQNAVIERLGDDFPLHQMLVVDFMHEFELGVWKNLFTHLVRLLYAQRNGEALVAELNQRSVSRFCFAKGPLHLICFSATARCPDSVLIPSGALPQTPPI
jgi:hypothetical protein